MQLPRLAFASAFLLAFASAALALELASPFTSHMVLQRNKPVSVWGWAEAGEQVTVAFAGQRQSTHADAFGRWQLKLDPMEASTEGQSFTIMGSIAPAPVRLDDVLVGEVWIASGQSNMDQTVARTQRRSWAGVVNEAEEIAAGDHPMVRLFTAEWGRSYAPRERVGGRWQVATPETVGEFSAIGYFFARDLSRELGIPVGVVVASFGATTAHAWIRREAVTADPELRPVLERFDEEVREWTPPSDGELAAWETAAEEARAAGRRVPVRPRPHPVQNQRNPAVMFNAMLAPIVPFTARGFLWYQGESITAPRELFPRFNEALINDWRVLWGEELPFYFCQLAGLLANSNSPEVRAWQAEALRLPNTAMAVTIDIGDERDVHPKNKQAAAERLARIALARDYGRPVAWAGPQVSGASLEGSAVRIAFAHAAGGLAAPDGELRWFELAGEDGNWVRAEARIEGDSVLASHPEVLRPGAVRYGWVNYPEGGGLLYDGAGLPAHPFLRQLGVEGN
jgi:sialate O-acetylesterase